MRYEYQILELAFGKDEDRLAERVRALNPFAREGWRLHEFQIDPIRAVNERPCRRLLERVVEGAPEDCARRLAAHAASFAYGA